MSPQQAPIEDPIFQAGMKVLAFLTRYHRYKIIGMSNIPKVGPAMIVISHSFATYESLLLAAEIYRETGRYCTGLGDRRIFQTPGLSQFFSKVGVVEGTPEVGEELLINGNLLVLSPGGMREAVRFSSERYQVNWEGRLGFARLAIKTQVPVILAACPNADDIFTLYKNPLTPFIYKNLKLPFAFLKGWGPSLIPRPVKLVHYLSRPIQAPPLHDNKVREQDVEKFQRQLTSKMQRLMKKSSAEA